MTTAVKEGPQELTLRVTDLSGQKVVDVTTPSDATFGELLGSLVPALELPSIDSNGYPLSWSALHQGESRRLLPQEVVGEACQPHDTVRLVPDIEAG